MLVLTNHFREFAGSEIVALEVARWFRSQGDVVSIGVNAFGDPIRKHASEFDIITDVRGLDLSAYDLIWCQHDLLSLLPVETWRQAAKSLLPHIALASLSPFEPMEHLNGLLAWALSADVYANSDETASHLRRENPGLVTPKSIRVFHNAAPDEFWAAYAPAIAPKALRTVTLISNHPPPELKDAIELLREEGVVVRHLGRNAEARLVGPQDVSAPDAVITIGKSVVYAVAQRKPVYMYDRFGGDGWLTTSNFSTNSRFNFSGRPAKRLLSARAIVDELLVGYNGAVVEAQQIPDRFDLGRYKLSAVLQELRARASVGASQWRRAKLRACLAVPAFRSALAATRQKAEVIRRWSAK